MTTKKKKFEIDIDKSLSYARIGIQRAYAFSGIVLNKNNKIIVKNCQIDEHNQLLPVIRNDETLINEFKKFVVKSALCDMIIDFEYTLNAIYSDIIIIENIIKNRQYDCNTHNEKMKKFKNYNFERKVKKINKYLNIDNTEKNLWENLKYVRNCIAHNYSVVNKGTIKLKIPIFTIVYKDETTKKEYRADAENPNLELKDVQGHPGIITIDFVPKEKIFKQNEIVTFTNAEINFLIYAMDNSINTLCKHMLYFLLDNGYRWENNGNIVASKDDLDKEMKKNGKIIRIEIGPNKTNKSTTFCK